MIVEQATIIEAPLALVMQVMLDVESIPTWATVKGVVYNVQGWGPGMRYDWQFTVDDMDFIGHSKIIEQTADTLITETTGDIASIWTIHLSPAGRNSTLIQAVVEYSPPQNVFVEVLADLVLQRYANPVAAQENMARFKDLVEVRAGVIEQKV
jgi:uncharacterized membrane protein